MLAETLKFYDSALTHLFDKENEDNVLTTVIKGLLTGHLREMASTINPRN